MSENSKTMLTGIKPTGRPHVGNYLGAMKSLLELQQEGFDTFAMVADYHALTTTHDAETLRRDSYDIVLDYLAIGLDPKKVTIFKQSEIPAHTELAWVFNCITTMPYLMRAHAFKDAEAKNKEVMVGTFDYPILMAADILLYDTDVVPVGSDQKQHVEYSRDVAEKFNATFGKIFKLPKEYIKDETATAPGIDGRKMSKSYDNTIPLFAEDEEIEKAVMAIVTDSKGVEEPKDPEECNIFALHKFFSEEDLSEIKRRYMEGGIGYKESKEILMRNLKEFVAPLREERKRLEEDPDYVEQILEKGAKRAEEVASEKMKRVKKAIGVENC